MDSTKQTTFGSNSLIPSNISRISIRRKSSFNKVRLRFENNSKDNLKNRFSDSILENKSVNGKQLLNIHSKSDNNNSSIEMSDSKSNQDNENHPIINKIGDEKNSPPVLVKNKIVFFENKSKNCKIGSKKSDYNKTMTSNNLTQNYGNSDKKVTKINNYCKEDKSLLKPLKSSTASISIRVTEDSFEGSIPSIQLNSNNSDNDINLISADYLHKSQTKDNQLSYERSLSICSNTSMGSDFVSFDTDSEVIFRKPVSTPPEAIKERPVPKQRTSLLRNSETFENRNTNETIDKIDSQSYTISNECHKRESKRLSGLSQDSGYSDISLNSSFLWQANKSFNKFDDKIDHKLNETEENIYYNEEADEHIYEELSNCRTLSSNEWIDIDSETKQIVSNRRTTIRPNNYRKSLRPIPHKRKGNHNSMIKLRSSISPDFNQSGSATEYEDIEDSEDNQEYHKTDSRYKTESKKDQHLSVSQHIYELMSDRNSHQIDGQTNQTENKNTLIREKSNKQVIGSDEPPTTANRPPLQNQSHEFGSNNQDIYRKKESVVDRNSSIYISPNSFQTGFSPKTPNKQSFFEFKRQLFEKQDSVTASIASYLEFNSYTEDTNTSFVSEPLYQFYQKDVRRRAELWIHYNQNDLEYDDFEKYTIYGNVDENVLTNGKTVKNNESRTQDRPLNTLCNQSSDKIESLCQRNISALDLVGYGPNRSLWCQLPQVINSKENLLNTLSDKEKRLQESMFEIITSEASYCKSLNILVNHFYNCNEFSENNPQILTQREKKCLFSNVIEISKISSHLLTQLEKRFSQNILLYDVCDIIYDSAVNQFQPYVHYCAYQRDQEKLLTRLIQTRTPFMDVLQRLESNQICQNQTLLSFLMLPMQRITRYPLLIDNVCQQLPPDSPLLDSCRKALGFINRLVRKCNEETKKVQRMQELIEIEKILHFRSNIKSYPIVSGARYLVKRGSVLWFSPQMSSKRTIGKSTLKWRKSTLHLFLFSDLLILAKKKSENNYSVFDYCARNTVQMISLTNNGEGIGTQFRILLPQNHKNLVQLILLHNHESKSVDYTISFELESEKLRWIEAVSQPLSDNPNETIYEEWDCPQVQCIKSYCAQQTDEISLEETDVLDVYRKMKDGWFEGQRIRDGLKGWFPSECTEEIINQHVRARNIRLRHRLLMYTQTVIDEQNKC